MFIHFRPFAGVRVPAVGAVPTVAGIHFSGVTIVADVSAIGGVPTLLAYCFWHLYCCWHSYCCWHIVSCVSIVTGVPAVGGIPILLLAYWYWRLYVLLLVSLLLVASLLLLAFLLLLASLSVCILFLEFSCCWRPCAWWRPCCVWYSRFLSARLSIFVHFHEKYAIHSLNYRTIAHLLSNWSFFLQFDLWILHIGTDWFGKLSVYRKSDEGLKLSDYRRSDL